MPELVVAACNAIARPVGGFDGFAAHMRSLLDLVRDAEIVVLPEYVTLELALPDDPDAPTDHAAIAAHTDRYRELFGSEARDRGQAILAGSHPLLEDGEVRNVAHLFGPDGAVRAHAKTHVVAEELAGGIVEGDEVEVVELPSVRVGILVCYEAEFPECATALAERGADVLLCPSLTHSVHGFWRVRHCLQARCVEHQVFAVHSGLGADPPEALGGAFARSAVLSPCDEPFPPGGVLAETEANREGVALAALDLGALERSRRECAAPTHRDRRRRAATRERWRLGGSARTS